MVLVETKPLINFVSKNFKYKYGDNRSLEMTRGRKYSRVRMIQLTMQGLSQLQIAKELGCDQATVSKALQKLYLFRRGYPTGRPRNDDHYSQMRVNAHRRRKHLTPDIIKLHREGYTVTEIMKVLGSTYRLVSAVLKEHNLDTSQVRGWRIRNIRANCELADQLAEYLESEGPQHVKRLNLSYNFRHHLRSDERFEFIKLWVSLGRWTRDPPRRLASGKGHVRINALAASRDPRIPAFIASQVKWTIDDQHEACSVMKRLHPQIGRGRATEVIEHLGYVYKSRKRVVVVESEVQ